MSRWMAGRRKASRISSFCRAFCVRIHHARDLLRWMMPAGVEEGYTMSPIPASSLRFAA